MNLAVHVTAHFFDQVVEETIAPRGEALVLGGTDAMALPVPEGRPHLARLRWSGPAQVTVEDADGRVQLLEGDGVVRIAEGPVALELRLVQRFRLRRLASSASMMATITGVFLLFIVLQGVGNTIGAAKSAVDAYCATWPNQVVVLCPPEGGPEGGIPGNTGSGDRWAEYLERILKEDFDGEEVGRLARGDRQHGEREQEGIYMPAGDKGPPDRMGGARETDLRPVRSAPVPKEPEPEPEPAPKTPEILAIEDGAPIDLPGLDDQVTENDAEGEDSERVDPEELREDREGWGIRDWYDQEDRARDELEIEAMKSLANRILRIDPDDPEALSVLAYYQYLSEDHDAALETYDKYIDSRPEEAAGYNNKALIYKRLGEYETEERLYRVALTLRPDDATALNNLAVNLSHQGRHDEALAIMERLEVLDPDEPYADLHRAKIYAEMGDDEQALVHLERALQGMKALDTLHHIEFRQDIRVDPSFEALRKTARFRSLLWRYYGDDSPVPQE